MLSADGVINWALAPLGLHGPGFGNTAVWLVMSLRPRVEIVVAGAALWAAGWASSLGLAWPVAVMEAVFIGAVATLSRNAPQTAE